jgi:diguanylate cyclase (GGDEF)-like protein
MTIAPPLSPLARDGLLEIVGEGALVLDYAGTITWANGASRTALGTTQDLRGTDLRRHLKDTASIENLLRECRSGTFKSHSLAVTTFEDGTELLATVRPSREAESILLSLKPLRDAVSSFDWAIRFATRDPITHLLNRDAFRDRLGTAVELCGSGVVLCANVNQFAMINEVYGTETGDQLLRCLTHRIADAIGPEVEVARIYGGRFGLFLTGADPAEVKRASMVSIGALHRTMAEPVEIAGARHPITFSIGAAIWPGDAGSADDLISAAETAIGFLAREGAGNTRWFDPAMRADRRLFLELEADLRRAIAEGQFTLHYQPKIRWTDRETMGFEALLRWTHPVRGAVSPARFIPVAEQSSLIVDIGQWVLREACRQQAEWRSQGLRLLPVAVNMSPQQMMTQSAAELLSPLGEYDIPAASIEIEITETAMMDRLPVARGVVEDLQRNGIHISIDDFGTGHSSLGNLRRLPIDVLKIDRSFVEDIDQSAEAYDIVATIAAMANALSLDVVAEGVETEPQAELLRAHGIDVMQGYLFAKPMPAAAAAKMLRPI